jgi:hypothetical protein
LELRVWTGLPSPKEEEKSHEKLTETALLVSVALLVVHGSAAVAQVLNPDNGHIYEVVEAPGGIPWDSADTAAGVLQMGGPLCSGYLATVTSVEEDNFIKSAYGAATLNTKWLGGFQQDRCDDIGIWEWVTGETWLYTDWRPGEPNDIDGQVTGAGVVTGCEDALQYRIIQEALGWNDAPHEWNYATGGYVVEYECLQVIIDIKPGSDPNSINNDGNGVIPVAILTTDMFDALTVDPLTVALDGAAVRVRGKGKAGVAEDVDGDGDLDLVVHIEDIDGTYQPGDVIAIINALTYDGASIVGSDDIRIVP